MYSYSVSTDLSPLRSVFGLLADERDEVRQRIMPVDLRICILDSGPVACMQRIAAIAALGYNAVACTRCTITAAARAVLIEYRRRRTNLRRG